MRVIMSRVIVVMNFSSVTSQIKIRSTWNRNTLNKTSVLLKVTRLVPVFKIVETACFAYSGECLCQFANVSLFPSEVGKCSAPEVLLE